MSASSRWAGEPAATPGEAPLVERTLADEEPVGPRKPVVGRDPDLWGEDERPARPVRPAPRRPAYWDEDEHTSARVRVAEEPRAPIDLDQVQTVAWSIVGAVLYLLGVVVAGGGLAGAFGWWAGGLLVLVAGAIPSGYSLLKASERRAERERRQHFEDQQERTNHDATAGIDIPIPR